jgi:predicted DNA-binding transcriptional regulator YafY
VIENFELYSTLLSYGEGIKVISPRNVMCRMKKKIAGMLSNYEEIKK